MTAQHNLNSYVNSYVNSYRHTAGRARRVRSAGRLRIVGVAVLTSTLLAGPALAAPGAVPGGEPARPAVLSPASVRVAPNVRVGRDQIPVRGLGLPGLAADPANPRHIVLVDEDFQNGTCDYHATFDGGSSWTGGHLSAPAGFALPPCQIFDAGGYAHSDASVAFGSGQRVYTTFSSVRGTAGDSILVATSTDGGRTFGPAVVAIAGGASGDPVYQRPKLTVVARAAGDRVLVDAWGGKTLPKKVGGCGSPCGYRIATATSTDGGSTWVPPVDATAAAEPGTPADAAPIGISREQSQPVVGSDGAAYIAWRTLVSGDKPERDQLVVGRSTDGGKTWTRVVAAGGGTPLNQLRAPKLAVAPDGTLYVAYADQSDPKAEQDIFVVHSTDKGTTWSSPVRANGGTAGAEGTGLPQIAVGKGGELELVWFDTRSANPAHGPGNFGDVVVAFSTDKGATFSAPYRVTDRTINFDMGLYSQVGITSFYTPAVTPLGNGTLMVAWGDTRQGNVTNGNQDIYTATVQLHASGPVPARTLSAGSAADVALQLSQLAYPGGEEAIGASGDKISPTTQVVIVGSDDPAAALAGSVLARSVLGPVLVSPAAGLPKAVKAEVARLSPTGAVLLGPLSSLSAKVGTDLEAAGVAKKTIARIAASDPAELAAQVATALDQRDDAAKKANKPAFPAVVVVDPDSTVAASAAGLAAGLQLPVLFVAPHALPAPTAAALQSLGITSTLVVGGASVIGADVTSRLPGVTRLAGKNTAATMAAVERAGIARGLPVNVVYVAQQGRLMDAAVLGAATARLGGLELVVDKADAQAARARLSMLGSTASADRIVAVGVTDGGSLSWWIIVLVAIFAVAGAAFLVYVLRSGAGPGTSSRRIETAGSSAIGPGRR